MYIRDIDFAFQNSQSNAICSVLTEAFSTDGLCCLFFAFLVFAVGLSTSFAAKLEGETKAQGDCYLVLAGADNIRSNSLLPICYNIIICIVYLYTIFRNMFSAWCLRPVEQGTELSVILDGFGLDSDWI